MLNDATFTYMYPSPLDLTLTSCCEAQSKSSNPSVDQDPLGKYVLDYEYHTAQDSGELKFGEFTYVE